MRRAAPALALIAAVLIAGPQTAGVSAPDVLSNLAEAVSIPDARRRGQFCRWEQIGEWKLAEPSAGERPLWKWSGDWRKVCDPQGGPLP